MHPFPAVPDTRPRRRAGRVGRPRPHRLRTVSLALAATFLLVAAPFVLGPSVVIPFHAPDALELAGPRVGDPASRSGDRAAEATTSPTPAEPTADPSTTAAPSVPAQEPSAPAAAAPVVPEPAPEPAPDPVPTEPTMVEQIVTRTNEERAAAGLPALAVSDCAAQQAVARTALLVAEGRFEHDPLEPILEACAARAVGENIALGYPTADAVVAGWMGSEGHRANILNARYTQIGVGCTKGPRGFLCAQVFVA
ncbi:CAP domain-containing protein [Cellulomonas sp. P5_C5]